MLRYQDRGLLIYFGVLQSLEAAEEYRVRDYGEVILLYNNGILQHTFCPRGGKQRMQATRLP